MLNLNCGIMDYVPFQIKDSERLNCLFVATDLFYALLSLGWFWEIIQNTWKERIQRLFWIILIGYNVWWKSSTNNFYKMKSSIFFSLYKNGRTEYRCLFVCLLVCRGLMEIQTPAPILMKNCTHIPTCPRRVSVQVWHPPPHPLGLGGLKP